MYLVTKKLEDKKYLPLKVSLFLTKRKYNINPMYPISNIKRNLTHTYTHVRSFYDTMKDQTWNFRDEVDMVITGSKSGGYILNIEGFPETSILREEGQLNV